jgi:hypothetical protein
MTQAPLLVAVAGLLTAACASSTGPGARRSAADHEQQARHATTARDHAAHLRAASNIRRKEAATCTPSPEPHGGHVSLLVQGTVASVEPAYQGVDHWRRVLRGASLLVTSGDQVHLEAAKKAIACHTSGPPRTGGMVQGRSFARSVCQALPPPSRLKRSVPGSRSKPRRRRALGRSRGGAARWSVKLPRMNEAAFHGGAARGVWLGGPWTIGAWGIPRHLATRSRRNSNDGCQSGLEARPPARSSWRVGTQSQ